MIIDVNCWTGPWGTHALPGEAAQVRESLRRIGVDRMCLSPLGGVWAHNCHEANGAVYAAADQWDDVLPVPVLDPTIATWPEELERARQHGRAPLVKWLPQYGRYAPEEMTECAGAIAEAGLGLLVQVRLEDARRQHPLAVVEDANPAAVARLAERHRDLTVVLGGAPGGAIAQLAGPLLELDNLYAEVSQVDGMDALAGLVQAGLGRRLLFGTHAPFFVPLAGLARVVADLDDEPAAAILGGNASFLVAD